MNDKPISAQEAMMDYLSDMLPKPIKPIKEEKTDTIDDALPPTKAIRLSAEDSLLYTSNKQSIKTNSSLAAQRQTQKRQQWPDKPLPVREPIAFNPVDILPKQISVAKPQPAKEPQEAPEVVARRAERLRVAREHHNQRIAARALKKQQTVSPAANRVVIQPDIVKVTAVSPVTEKSAALIKQDAPSKVITSDAVANKMTEAVVLDEWQSNGRPEWGQARFECLLFTVSGLKLAVPLVTLGAIHTIDKELTIIPGRAPWYLGMFSVHEHNINVIDTARFVMPERIHHSEPLEYQYAIRLDDSDWAMGCNTVEQSISLSPDDVKWRSQRGKRPWLAGTVVDYMCALMDVRALCQMFNDASKKR